MNCDCTNICGGTRASTPAIHHVYGNVLRLAIPLTLRTLTKDGDEVVVTDTDFIPSSDYPVNVIFSRGKTNISIEPAMDGNIAAIEDEGTIPVGTYDITVECCDELGQPYRFKQSTVIDVVDITADAGIEPTIEYEAKVWYLNAAIFLATTEISSMTEEIERRLTSVFGAADYDAENKVIRFYDKNREQVLATIDSTPFVVDGTVDDVYIDVDRQVLVVVLNEDAGGRRFTVPLYLILQKYYKRSEVDGIVNGVLATVEEFADSLDGYAPLREDSQTIDYRYLPPVVLQKVNQPVPMSAISAPWSSAHCVDGKIRVKWQKDTGQSIQIGWYVYQPAVDQVYYCKDTQMFYLYDDGEMVEIPISGSGGVAPVYVDGTITYASGSSATYSNGTIIL